PGLAPLPGAAGSRAHCRPRLDADARRAPCSLHLPLDERVSRKAPPLRRMGRGGSPATRALRDLGRRRLPAGMAVFQVLRSRSRVSRWNGGGAPLPPPPPSRV